MPLERRRDGEKIKAIPLTDWNLMAEAARAYHAGKFSTTSPASKLTKDAGIFQIGNSGSSAIDIFSTVGLDGLPFTGIDGLLNRVRFKTGTIDPERVAVLSAVLLGNCGTNAVYDGLTPCRIKLNRDPAITHTRATPVAGETYMLADELGLYDVLWHSDKKAEDAEADAEQGDLVYAIVRIGQPIRQWVSVQLDYTSDLAEPIDVGGGSYIYSATRADTIYGTLAGSTIDTPVWLTFGGGVNDMVFWDSNLKLDGYFHGFYEHEDETRPLITIPENPIKKLFGKWTTTPDDTGTVDIYVDRSTQLGTYSVTAGATKMGNVSAADAWVYVEYDSHATLGRAWEVTAEACPDA